MKLLDAPHLDERNGHLSPPFSRLLEGGWLGFSVRGDGFDRSRRTS